MKPERNTEIIRNKKAETYEKDNKTEYGEER